MSCDCSQCASASTLDVVALAREIGAPLPPATHREQVRASLLAASRSADVLDAPRAPRFARRRLLVASVVAAAAAAAAAAIALFVTQRTDDLAAGHAHATVRAFPGASYLALTTAPDELVVLNDGAIAVAVAPLHPRERFRVIVGGDEIEVHGTEFIATARAGKLSDVRVVHGIVEVRPRLAPAAFLRAGEAWRAADELPPLPAAPRTAAIDEPSGSAQVTAEASRARAPAPRIERAAPAPTPEPAPPPPGEPAPSVAALPHEAAFDEGWAAMREDRFADAAKAFLRVQLLDPDGALAEDAAYWYAVALARSRDTRAIAAFREFLSHYASSRRAGEASAMLGWLLVDARQPAEAKQRFTAAIDDANPAVRKSARAGLDALAK